MPWARHHVVAAALSGGSAAGSYPSRGYFFTGGYEWGTATGGRGILIRTPKLIVTFKPTERTERIAKIGAAGGGYVFNTAEMNPRDVPVENMKAMIAAAAYPKLLSGEFAEAELSAEASLALK